MIAVAQRLPTHGVAFLCFILVMARSVDSSAQDEATRVAATDISVRVMSFNLRYGSADDGENRWELRRDLLIETIRNFAPDVLGTQETLRFQADFIQQHCKEYTYVGKSREPESEDGEQCGIFFRTSRFSDLEQGHFWLSEQPNVPGTKSWDSSLPRMATWVKLYDNVTQQTLYMFNTHFDHVGAQARAESASLIRTRINMLPSQAHVIVTGDFNCDEGSKPYQNLLHGNEPFVLKDTFRAVKSDRTVGEGTFNGFKGVTEGARIDWILCNKNLVVAAAAIDHATNEGRYPSDHFPVTAVIKYE